MSRSQRLYFIIATIILLLGGLTLVAVVGRDKYFFQQTSTGLAYKVKEKGPGPLPTAGQILLIEMTYKTKENQVIFNSDDMGFPMVVPYDEIVGKADGGICEAIGMLQKGDRYFFKLPAKTLLGVQFETLAAKHKLEAHTLLYLQLYLKDITTEEGMKTIEAEYLQAMMKKRQEHTAQQLPKDIEAIDAYLHKHQLKAAATPSGLRYLLTTPGEGAYPQPGNIVSVNYVGRTLEGKVFDTNIVEEAKKHQLYDDRRTYEPMKFTIGTGNMIPGFEEGIVLLNKHAVASLLVPSVLAYRELELPPHIKPHSSLIFDVELVDIQTEEVEKENRRPQAKK